MRHAKSIGTGSQPTRRSFLQLAGGASVAILAGSCGNGRAAGVEVESQAHPTRPAGGAFELGLASYSFRSFSLDHAVAMTVRVGLKHICLKSFHLPLNASPERIAEATAKVRAAGLDLYGVGVINMKNEAEVEQAFDYAKAVGVKTIVAAPSHGLLPLLGDKAKAFDIRVAIHNHGPGDKMFPTPESVYEKVKGLDKRVGLCMDIGHTLRIGADPVRDARRFSDRLLDVHMKDVTAAAPAGEELEAGRGVIDLVGFLRVLVETKYPGIVSFEYEKDPKDPLPGLAESVGYVRGVLAAIK